MNFMIVVVLTALVLSSVSCKDVKDRIRLLRPPKDKRGTADHPSGYSQHLYNLNSYTLPGHSFGGYVLPPTLNAGLGHGFNFASGLGQRSSYSTPGLFAQTQSKTGPVTFSNPAPSFSSPLYVSAGMQDLAKYTGHGSSGIQILLGAPISSSRKGSIGVPSGHQSPLITTNVDSSNTVTGGYVLAGGQNDASYVIPMTAALSSLSYPYPSTSSYSSGYPSTSSSPSYSSHGLPTYSRQAPSTSYSSPSSHVGLSSGSSDSSSYTLPISSSSYSVSSASGSKKYIPVSSSGSVYATANSIPSSSSSSSSSAASYSLSGGNFDKSNSAYTNSVSYSGPASAYSNSAKNYDTASSSYIPSYPTSGSSYPSSPVTYVTSTSQQAAESISNGGVRPSYPKSVSNYFASPSTSYTDSSNSYPGDVMGYSSQASSYASPAESTSYSNLVPQYISYAMEKSSDNVGSNNFNYDTISYSTANGKYA